MSMPANVEYKRRAGDFGPKRSKNRRSIKPRRAETVAVAPQAKAPAVTEHLDYPQPDDLFGGAIVRPTLVFAAILAGAGLLMLGFLP